MTDQFSFVSEIATAIVCILLAIAAWYDLASRTIPDRISLAAAAICLTARCLEGGHAVLISVAAAVALFVCLLPLNAKGLLGGADVKLLTALFLGYPPLASLHMLTLVTICGAILALTYLALGITLRRLPAPHPGSHQQPLLRRIAAVERYRIRKATPLPYAVAIAAGGICFAFVNPGV